jgi:hypothetical protein
MVQSVGFSSPAVSSLPRPSGPPPDPKEVFSRNDSDGDGTLNADELQTLLDEVAAKMGGDGPTAADLLKKLDGDGDGSVSGAEFEAGRPQGPPPDMASYTADGTQEQNSRRFGLNIKV